MCGAPIVMTMLLNAAAADRRELKHAVEIMTAGSAPPAAVIEGMETLGFKIIHVYGLTEVYGPAVVCAWHEDWDAKPAAERAALEGAPGRQLSRARGAHGGGSRRRWRPCRRTARPWARFSCAATS